MDSGCAQSSLLIVLLTLALFMLSLLADPTIQPRGDLSLKIGRLLEVGARPKLAFGEFHGRREASECWQDPSEHWP